MHLSFGSKSVHHATPTLPLVAALTLAAPITLAAQTTTPPAQKPIATLQQTIDVTATPDTLKDTESTGSRLNLTPLETPAAIEVVPAEVLTTRGFQQIEDAVDSLPGVSSGGSPADPSQFVARGFVGNQVSLLRDGIYVGPANMVTRAENSFNLQSVDLLQGPASVLYGQGAVGGTINVITKQPTFSPLGVNAYASLGTFHTYELGIGAGGQLTKSIAVRSDLSYYASNGYVVDSNPNNLNGDAKLLWKISPKLSLRVALDVLRDNLSSYYGTPFVSAAFGTSPIQGVLKTSDGTVLDARTRYNNYNVSDAVLSSDSYQPSATFDWLPTPNLSITDQVYYYHAARNWKNSETYKFVAQGTVDGNGNLAAVNEFERDRFQVHHNQNLPGNSLNLGYSKKLAGHANKLSAGYSYYAVNFRRSRGFNFANNWADVVDALNPVQGTYDLPVDPGDNDKRVSPTRIHDNALYIEDAFNVTSKFILVGGLHFENFYLNRLNYGPTGVDQTSSDFSGTYHPFNARIGGVYSLAKGLSLYGQYANAATPPGNNIFLVNQAYDNNGNVIPFKLATSNEGEVGLKAALPHNYGEATLALYDISLNHILTATQTSNSTDDGQQHSKGFEFSTILHPVRLVDVNFNTAYTHARFGYFSDPNTGLIDSGLIPADVPANTTNLSADVHHIATLPLEIGAGWRFVGGRYADNANQTKLYNYSLLDAFGAYSISERFSLTLRGKNLLNKAYAQWADINYPTEINLGSPRTVTVSLTGHF